MFHGLPFQSFNKKAPIRKSLLFYINGLNDRFFCGTIIKKPKADGG